jgi:hypothetical protein
LLYICSIRKVQRPWWLKKVERLFAFLSYFLLEAVVLDDDEDAAEIWQTIKQDGKRHMHMLKEALEEEIHP